MKRPIPPDPRPEKAVRVLRGKVYVPGEVVHKAKKKGKKR